MLSKETIKFLKMLEKNNERQWFNEHKDMFVRANDNIIAITGDLIDRISKFDSSVAGIDPKSCVFRIYRDVRFSTDKSPYKTNLGAFITPGGKKNMLPGYYFHIQSGMFFAAAGKHMPDGAELQRIRSYIAANGDEFNRIVSGKAFSKRFGELDGERLSRPPKGFDANHPAIEFLKLKSFTVSENFTEKDAVAPDYPKKLASSFETAAPLVEFLRKAVA